MTLQKGCKAKRHILGDWFDTAVSDARVLRSSLGGLSVQLIEQRRPLFEEPADRRNPTACCSETRAIVRVVGDVTSPRMGEWVRAAVLKLEAHTHGPRREHLR
jgi:hypothetical protein